MFEGFQSTMPVGSLQGVPTVLAHWGRARRPTQPWFTLLHTFEAHDPYGERNHPFPDRTHSREENDAALAALGLNPSPRDITRALVLDLRVREALTRDATRADAYSAFTRYIWNGWRDAPDLGLVNELRTEYRAGVRWVDGLLDQALTSFESAGLLKDTLVIVTGDHGEAFGEHGLLLHGRTLHEELLRVPLVMMGPPPFDGGRTVRASVSLLDLLPTVLEWLGLPPLPGLPGRSLLPLLHDDTTDRPVHAQVVRGLRHTDGLEDAELESVRSTTWKFTLTRDRRTEEIREELYDLAVDGSEQHDLAADPATWERLAKDTAFSAAVATVRGRQRAAAGPIVR
jgi:arylsulfatase A-like enzyme